MDCAVEVDGSVVIVIISDVNKDLSHKDKDQDQDLTLKDKDKDKDLSRTVNLIAICSLIVSHQVQPFRFITNSL